MSRTEKPLDLRNTPVCPEKTWNERFDNDNDSQTIYNFLYSGNYDPSLRNTLMFKLMRDLLQQRVIEILRKKMNIVYSPFVDVAYKGIPQQIYYFWFSIAVKNENRNILKSTIRDIIDDLQRNPVSMRELDKMRRSFIVTKRRQLNDNSMSEWKSALSGLIRNGEDIQDFDSYSQVLYSITPEDVRKAFCKYINKDVYVNLYQSVCKE
jgi:zinc protease